MQESGYTKIVNAAALLLIAVLTVHIMSGAQFILLPLVWALFISLLILPAVRWLEEKKVPRPLAIIIMLVIVTAVLSLVLYLLSLQIVGLLRDVPALTEKLDRWIGSLQLMAEENLEISHEVMTQQISNSVSDMVYSTLVRLRDSLFSVFRTLTLISVIPLYVFFMLYYRDTFYKGFLGIAKNYRTKAHSLINKINRIIQQYIIGLMAVTVIIAFMFYITLSLLGIEYALFFAVFLAIFNLIPYIGVIIASLAVLLYAVATSDSLFYPVAVLLFLWIIQLIENNLISPYILGTRVEINPMVALIAIFTGAGIWGVSGMILFIPLLGALKIVFDEIDQLKPLGILLGDHREHKEHVDNTSS